MKSFKRVFRYVKGQYHLVFLSILMIVIVQLLGFITPLIVKSILDDYVLGIEYTWVEVTEETEKTVSYNDKYYKQERYLLEDEIYIKKVSIVVYKTGFYFVDEEVRNGGREIVDNKLTVTNINGEVFEYQTIQLDAGQVYNFYQPIFKSLIFLIALLLIKSILVIVGTYVQRLSTNKVITIITRDSRTAALRSVERLPINYFENEPAGKMAARITSDVDGLIIFYRLIVNTLVSAVLSFILAYVGMFYLDSRLALLSLLIYPVVFIWIKYFLKYLKKIAVKVNELRSLLTAKINEIINGITILQIFNFRKQTVSEFNEINKGFMNEQLKEVKLHVTLGWNMMNVLRGLITVAIVVYFGLQYLNVYDVVITAGLIYAYNEYLLKIVEPIGLVFNQVSEFQHSLVRIERVSKLIDGEVEDYTKYDVPRYNGDIKFDDVWFAYTKKDYVLKGVSFDCKAGQMIGLVGHTGSGKSSLMNLLLRFYDLDKENHGHIYVDGIDISSLPKRAYREHLGIVLQEPVLFKGTIASNIRFGKEDITNQQIEDVLRSIGGDAILDKLELGINQPITRAGVNMSSGEKQIISLARAILHNPSILIMDEATSHIDTETEEMIKKALDIVCKNRTVIVIAHRLSTIYNADKIIVLDHGLKVEEGTHHELVDRNGVYANIYRSQVANTKNFIEQN